MYPENSWASLNSSLLGTIHLQTPGIYCISAYLDPLLKSSKNFSERKTGHGLLKGIVINGNITFL
jgi:hypothetical protein